MNFSWVELTAQAVSEYETPLYISAWAPVLSALDELKVLEVALPIRHWLSFKTHPVAPLVRAWRNLGNGVEVVSEYEFLAALKEGFEPDRILVNGVAKHKWLSRHRIRGIRVHFDSLREIEELATQAITCEWRVGIRCHVTEEYDPDEPEFADQFGMLENEAVASIRKLHEMGALIESVHFHIRTNVSSADSYLHSIKELSHTCRAAKFSPIYVDCGGGLPVPGECSVTHGKSQRNFDLSKLRQVFAYLPSEFQDAHEIWLENGRYVTARSAVLVVRVVDIKNRADSRYLICDGGRTNHALVSDWEVHDISTLPLRDGSSCLTTVCGPTCMAFDRLIRMNLPNNIQIGDYIIWMNAGAYHIPWETRFSYGLAKVIWCDENGRLSVAREKESFSHWWSQWL